MPEPVSAASAASVKAAGQVTGALIGRTRPGGVARVGSREDRIQAYRIFLDALVRYAYENSIAQRTTTPESPLPLDLAEADKDLISALFGLRLCAPPQVLYPAEDAVLALPSPVLEDDLFAAGEREYLKAVNDFLKAARRDMNFNVRRWQIWRWWALYKQRKYLKQARLSREELIARRAQRELT